MRKVRLLNWPDLKVAGQRNRQTVEKISGALKPTDFLLSWARGRRYMVKTYGCQANVRDSEIITAYLEKLGMSAASDPADADLVLLNTCAIREHAETRIHGELGHLAPLARRRPDLIVGLCGCMAQEEATLTSLRERCPQLNLVFGTHNIHCLYDLLEECVRSKTRLFSVPSTAGNIVEDYPEHRFDPYKAFVNIMYGCDKFCTYCIVPYTRGAQRSRAIADVVGEVESLVARGYKEVTLLGQNVNAYGCDQPRLGRFSDLLAAVAETGIERIRFMSPHPADFEEEVFRVMARYPNIMPSLHLPLQSGSSSVLRKMNRRYDRERYLELVAMLRRYLPQVRLTTDIICCFPTEEESDLTETISLVREVGFDSAYNFIYSPRAGTPAARWDNPLTAEQKQDRFQRLQRAIDEVATARALKAVGLEVAVLVDGIDEVPGRVRGYDEGNRLVHFAGSPELLGRIVKVRITESHTYSFIGELSSVPAI